VVLVYLDQLATPILRALEGTNKQWLSDLLHAFNRGDIGKFNEIIGKNTAEYNSQVRSFLFELTKWRESPVNSHL
jgi:hypothetical protein